MPKTTLDPPRRNATIPQHPNLGFAMHLFAPERPTTLSGVPAIVLDGSSVPSISCFPNPNGTISLAALFHNYDTKESYSYSYKSVNLTLMSLADFFRAYMEDPEECFLHYFGWKAQAPNTPKTKIVAPRPLPVSTPEASNFDAISDLI